MREGWRGKGPWVEVGRCEGGDCGDVRGLKIGIGGILVGRGEGGAEIACVGGEGIGKRGRRRRRVWVLGE